MEDYDEEELDVTDADAINIADFEDEIKEYGDDIEGIVGRIIDLSETTDMSSDDIDYMYDVLKDKVIDYLNEKKSKNENTKDDTSVSNIVKALTANDLGRNL